MAKRKDDFFDDGRTVAPMDIEGMPFVSRGKSLKNRKKTDPDAPALTKKELRQLVFSGIVSGALIALVFIVAAAVLLGLIYFLA